MYDVLTELLTDRFQVRPELLSPEATPASLGLDSLFLVELSLVLEKDPGCAIGVDDLTRADTLADIARLMRDNLEAPA
ncbi:acyl carrier protein [Streptomyces sp. MAA16]|uniref:acyl carrier protein n=1 Tax=Streptomyces sp. MAA16 TaxID=3035116 RepID=UPI00247441BE|nr:acyl carrier protein [Streptomyces sp. MAA16]MDH6696584.1 acyl carrier protein [Streptomyces sp. MAA16]